MQNVYGNAHIYLPVLTHGAFLDSLVVRVAVCELWLEFLE